MEGAGWKVAWMVAWPAMLGTFGLAGLLLGSFSDSSTLSVLLMVHSTARVVVSGRVRAECSHDRQVALRNYRMHGGKLYFYHITHHAGTAIQEIGKKNGRCVIYVDPFVMTPDNLTHRWLNVYHEEGDLPPGDLSSFMPCNMDGFISITSVRDPIGRTFSGDGSWKSFPNGTNTDLCHSDNYGLRKLIGKPLPTNLTWEDVEFAIRRLASFDLVFDQGDFENSAKLFCAELGFSYCGIAQKPHREPKEYLPENIYNKLRQRNRFELAMYEYGKALSRSMIRSSELAERWPTNATLKSLQRYAIQRAGQMPEPVAANELSRYVSSSCPDRSRRHAQPHGGKVPKHPRRAWTCPVKWQAHD